MTTVLEVTARMIGFGHPIVYYNATYGGIRPLPNQRVERFRDATVTIDSNGFRTANPDEEFGIQVLFVGDSVTWGGTTIDDNDLFSEVASDVVRAEGTDVYSMNAGVNGTGLMNQADVYLSCQDSADLLVWLFPWASTLRCYTTAGFLWPPTKKPRFALVEAGDHLIRTQWLTRFRTEGRIPQGQQNLFPEVAGGYENFFEGVLEERTRRNVEVLKRTVETAVNKGTPVIVGITPEFSGSGLVPNSIEAAEHLQQLASLGAQILDVHQVLSSGEEDIADLYLDRIHLTREGHRLVGEALGKLLQHTGDQRQALETDSTVGMSGS